MVVEESVMVSLVVFFRTTAGALPRSKRDGSRTWIVLGAVRNCLERPADTTDVQSNGS